MLNVHEILQLLQAEKPVSIIRAGDGESLTLACIESYALFDRCSKSVMERQLGFAPSVNDIKAIRENLISAYGNADVIGFPNHKNLDRLGSQWQLTEERVRKYAPNETAASCSTNIHYDFLETQLYDVLLQNKKNVYYVSCRQLEDQMKQRWNISRVSGYHISPEARFTSGYDGEPHWPTQFNKIQRWMTVMEPEGKLLLVGAGVIGKIYCNYWRDMGGKAFDIGSIFDEWAGRVTRGPERGLDKEDLTYKL